MARLDPRATEWRFVDGEIIALDLHTEEYLSIKGSGVLLWRALADVATEEELADMLCDRYGIPADRAAADVAAFLATLNDRKLLIR